MYFIPLQLNDHSSDGLNSETETTEQTMFSSNVPHAYMSPSDAKREYVQQKLMEIACVRIYVLCALPLHKECIDE